MCNIQTNAEETDNLRTRSRLQMPEGVNTTPYVSTNFPGTLLTNSRRKYVALLRLCRIEE